MSNVIPLHDHANDDPHVVVQHKCRHCGYENLTVKPVGYIAVECPECHNETLVPTALITPDEFLECGCGNTLFTLGRTSACCAGCGEMKVYAELSDGD
jgi:phage FluMu protein Com